MEQQKANGFTQAARDERTLLDALLDNLPAMVGYWDRDLRNQLANQAYVEWFGLTPEEMLGRHIRDVLGEGLFELNRPFMEGALRGEAQLFERMIVDTRGLSRHTQASYIPDLVDGVAQGFFVLVTDITARKRAEEALAVETRRAREALAALSRSEERLRLLVDGSRDYAILMLDANGLIVTWSAGAERLKGYTAEEVVGRHFSIFYTPEARASEHPASELALAREHGRYEEEGWRVRKDGSLFWANVVITALYDETGALRGFGKVTRDLTERRAAEEALRQSEERFHRAFDDAPTGEALLDVEGRFLQVNDALCRLTGRSVDQLLAVTLEDITCTPNGSESQESLAKLSRGQIGSLTRDARIRHAQGHDLWINLQVVPLRDEDGTVTGLLAHLQDISGRRRYEEQLVELANTDALTGLANRTKFNEELAAHLARCRRHGPVGAVLMMDLDNFKRVNDTLGHNVGDQLIIELASTLRRELRTEDVAARLGGDEFAILLPDADHDQAGEVAERLVLAVRDSVAVFAGTQPRTVTASIGVVVIDDVTISPGELLINADLAMYDAKDAGRDRTAFYAQGGFRVPKSKARMTWADRIERALAEDSFELWVQPVLDLNPDAAKSYEVLLRMRAPDGELVAPGTFLYVAERVGLIGAIDRWVTTRAIDLLARLQPLHPGLRLEINLSGLSIGDEQLREHIGERIETTGVDPTGLIFEITETAAVNDVVSACSFAEALRELGCRFALDDFGAGFGSFYYLKHLPFDYVKIDGEFVANCTSNLTDRLVIDSVVTIAQGLGKQTIAEFVGDQSTLDYLRTREVDLVQGNHIGCAVPVDEAFPELSSVPGQRQPSRRSSA